MRFIYYTSLILALLFCCTPLCAQRITIHGTVKDAATHENLIGASIYCPEANIGITTNTYGFYSLSLPRKNATLIISYVGYSSRVIEINNDSEETINIELESGQTLDEIEITDSRADNPAESTRMGTIDLPISQIKSVPALLGEVDVLKVLQLLPGVQSGTEGSSGLYVRGGGADQNLILLDGVPVYNAAHLFGFFSVFNADAINHVELIKGGFPARYGGRLSSVIDISMKEGNDQKIKAQGSIGLISSKITVDGPVRNKNTSFIVSLRRTYLDALQRIAQKFDNSDETSGYYFYDLNAKLNHRINKNNRIFLSAYSGNDKSVSRVKFQYKNKLESSNNNQNFLLRWGNVTSALRWNSIISPQVFANVTATFSQYRFDTQTKSLQTFTNPDTTITESYASDYRSGIRDYAFKVDFDFFPTPAHTIRIGGQAIQHRFTPGARSIHSNISADAVAGSTKKNASELALYLEDDFSLSRFIKFNLGAHASGFNVDNNFYSSIQPRLSARVLINPHVSWKISYVRMTQYIHLLTNSGIGLPTDLWVPATGKIGPQSSKQTSTGVTWNLKDKYEVSVESYIKEMDGLIEYQDGASFLDVQRDWQDKVETGKGRSKGIEFFIHRKTGKLNGWIGYTLSKTERQFSAINNGNWFPYRYDRRHDIEIVTSYNVKPMKDFSASWVFGTGNTVTLPRAMYGANYEFIQINQISESIKYYGGRNQFRMPAYHRLDVSYSVRKKKKWGERSWTFSVYNLYNRKNPFFLAMTSDYRGQRIIQHSLFPIIPSISYGFKF